MTAGLTRSDVVAAANWLAGQVVRTPIACSPELDSRDREEPPGLPLRWAIIALLTAGAAVVGHRYGGPVAAITAGTAVALAAHRLLA